jgi:EpsI family protein
VAIGLIILCITTGYLVFFKPVYIPLKHPLASFPHQIGAWQGKENETKNSLLKEVKTKDRLDRVYQDSNGGEITLSIRYFPIQHPDQKIVGYRTDGLLDEGGVVSIPAGNREVVISSARIKNSRNASTVYFWYAINGKILVNRYKAKMESLLEAALKRKTNGAIVAISVPGVPGPDDKALEFLKELIPLTESYLQSS